MWHEYFSLLASIYLLSLLFFFAEVLHPAEKNQSIGKRLYNLIYLPLLLAVLVLCLQPLCNYLYSIIHFRITGNGIIPSDFIWRASFGNQFLFAFLFAIVWDIWQYLIHRLQHASTFFWQTHKFHHGETALNSSTQTRHHVLSHLLYSILYLPVLLIFGSRTPHYLAIFVMFRLWGFINHMNVRMNFGPLTFLLSGPQWHRIHHSHNAEHQGKNFAAFFPFIDIIFGTYYHPRKNEYPPTGLLTGEESYLLASTLAPFAAWLRLARRSFVAKNLLSHTLFKKNVKQNSPFS